MRFFSPEASIFRARFQDKISLITKRNYSERADQTHLSGNL